MPALPLRELQQGDQVAGFFVEQVKDWGDNVSVKLSGGQLSDGAWVKFYRDEMSDARQLERAGLGRKVRQAARGRGLHGDTGECGTPGSCRPAQADLESGPGPGVAIHRATFT